MEKIKSTCIKNPFQARVKENRDEREFEFKNQTIRDIFCQYFPIPSEDMGIVASVNGKVYDPNTWDVELSPGDHVVFVPIPKGGGGGGSNVMMIVAMVVIAAISWGAGSLAFSAMYGAAAAGGAGVSTAAWGAMTVAGAMVSAAIMVGGGMLVSSMFPVNSVGIEKGELSDTSPTYGWSTYANATSEGAMLPVIIGERRVTPPLIASHAENNNGDAYLYLMYAVSEGPIESLYGVLINEQPISYYSNVEIQTRLGYDSQSVMNYFGDVYADTNVGVLLNKSGYITRQTTGDGVDAVQVHISLPMGLWYANDKGVLDVQTMVLSIQYKKVGTSDWQTHIPTSNYGFEAYNENKVYNVGEIVYHNGVFYKCTKYYTHLSEGNIIKYDYVSFLNPQRMYQIIKLQSTPPPPNSNCWAAYTPSVTSLVIISKSNSAISKTYRIDFPSMGQYEIRAMILSGPPDNNPRYGSKAVWGGLTEIIKDDISYPGVALIGLKVKATDQLSGGMPQVTCIAKKTSHTFPIAGVVNLQNPAWATYYIMNNPTWGCNIPESKMSLVDFQSWASFCDLKGITSNMYLDQRLTFNEVKGYYEEIGRARVVQMGVYYNVVIDKPDVPTQLFTIGNILPDSFKMDYLPIQDRANVIRVNFYDKEKNWEKSTVEIRTNEFITGSKEKSQDITLYACDNKWIAARHGRLLLNYNKNLIRTCSFDVSIDALACTIGDIILVQHDATRYGFGGRIVGISGTTVTLDRKVAFSAGVTYGIIVRRDEDDGREQRTFTVSTTDEYDSVIINSAFSDGVAPYNVYSVGQYNIEAKPFRIISLTRSEEFIRKVSALEYNELVYDDSEIIDEEINYFAPPIAVGLSVSEIIDNVFSKFSIARLSWSCPAAKGVNVYMSHGEDADLVRRFVGTFKTNSTVVNEVPIGIPITFEVVPIGNSFGAAEVTETFWGEDNAIYDSGCYEYDVFASHQLQEKVGFKAPLSLWMQEPETVSMTFIN
jgi:hypothetical protein